MSTCLEKTDKTKRRSDMACRRCRARKLKCENKDSVAPCKRCEAENQQCMFMSVADDTGAMGAKPPRSANISRGSSEEGRNNHSITPVSPTQLIPSASLPSSRTPNQSISPPHGRGSLHDPTHTYSSYSHPQPQHGHASAPNAASPPGFSGLGYRREGSFPAVGGSQDQWSASTQPVYPMHPSMTPPYINPGSSRPPAPIQPSYAYSPSSNSYPQSMYASDQEPRSFNNQGYYNPVESGHELSNPEQQYYLPNSSYPHNPQPNGLPGYPDPNMIPNAQQDSGSDYYYTR